MGGVKHKVNKRQDAHIHVELQSDAQGVYARAWIERPGNQPPPTMLTVEPTRREAIASVLGWAWGLRRYAAGRQS